MNEGQVPADLRAIEARAEALRKAERSRAFGIETFNLSPKVLAQVLDEDIPYLLAELRARDETIAAVGKWNDGRIGGRYMELARILKEGK